MKNFYMLLISVVLVKAEEHENFNIESLLSDPNKVQSIASCFLDKASCDDVAASLKNELSVVVKSSCDKCTPEEKHIVKAFIDAFNKAPNIYESFKDKYDPEGKYLPKLEVAVAAF